MKNYDKPLIDCTAQDRVAAREQWEQDVLTKLDDIEKAIMALLRRS